MKIKHSEWGSVRHVHCIQHNPQQHTSVSALSLQLIAHLLSPKECVRQILPSQILLQLWFPSISIRQQLLLVIQQFLVRFRGIFKVWSLHNGSNGTRTLAKSAKDAFGQINVISRSPPAPIRSFLCFNRDGSCRTRQLTQSARDTPLLPRWVPSQCVFPSIPRGHWPLLERVHDGHFGLPHAHRRL